MIEIENTNNSNDSGSKLQNTDARTSWRVPYFSASLLQKVLKKKALATDNHPDAKSPIKTQERNCTIIPDFVGMTFDIHNGKGFARVFVQDNMIGHKLGEFSPTRSFKGHSGTKKKKDGKK